MHNPRVGVVCDDVGSSRISNAFELLHWASHTSYESFSHGNLFNKMPRSHTLFSFEWYHLEGRCSHVFLCNLNQVGKSWVVVVGNSCLCNCDSFSKCSCAEHVRVFTLLPFCSGRRYFHWTACPRGLCVRMEDDKVTSYFCGWSCVQCSLRTSKHWWSRKEYTSKRSFAWDSPKCLSSWHWH